MKQINFFIIIAIIIAGCIIANAQVIPLFRNEKAPGEERIRDLLHRLTLPEKIAMPGNSSPAVNRLKIPAYNWWNESLHGLARAGEATVFPQAIGLAATFNDDCCRKRRQLFQQRLEPNTILLQK
ncbi:hypothetical protein [Ferruginibacter sp.]|uniref:hypothetical protein n=1 Tax=Ferruginibacter sp. TaxID=1940288 RepID=UPI0026580D97|nr:hypothetical protein [Ferruginibacter sp.]